MLFDRKWLLFFVFFVELQIITFVLFDEKFAILLNKGQNGIRSNIVLKRDVPLLFRFLLGTIVGQYK